MDSSIFKEGIVQFEGGVYRGGQGEKEVIIVNMKYIEGAGGVFLVKYGVRFMKIGGYGKNRRIGQENPKIKSNDQKSYETF